MDRRRSWWKFLVIKEDGLETWVVEREMSGNERRKMMSCYSGQVVLGAALRFLFSL